MILETIYNENDTVWVLNPKTGEAVQRRISGIRTQSIFGEKKTIYCFLKDWSLNKQNPTYDDCFWLTEDKVFSTKQSLINSL